MTDAAANSAAYPAARLLGREVVSVDLEARAIVVSFTLGEPFLNPVGTIQGGFVAAALDDVYGPTVTLGTGGQVFAPVIDCAIHYFRPARPGRFTGRGRIVHLGSTTVVADAELYDADDRLVARGSYTGQVLAAADVLAGARAAPAA